MTRNKPKTVFMVIKNGEVVFCSDSDKQMTLNNYLENENGQ